MFNREVKTYIYIDVSNIRWACQRSCGFNLDFIKLYNYFKNKYPNLQDVRYYEGIAHGDTKKARHFDFLRNKIGYTVCSLERKSYADPPKYELFECKNCHTPNMVKTSRGSVKLKSNVDVYLASDMIEHAVTDNEPTHIILVSCDGDYVEAIDTMLRLNSSVKITILATPFNRSNNCLSRRLTKYTDRRSVGTALVNINSIKDYISQLTEKA